MKPIRILTASALGLAASAGIWTSAGASPAPQSGYSRFEVTITNVSKGQIFAPAIVATHDHTTQLFELGAPVSPELAFLAEEGDPSSLAGALAADPGVLLARTGGGLLMPGDSTTIVTGADDLHPFFSVAGMLVSTNDGFFAVRGVEAPLYEGSHLAHVYDAGSEVNSEDCAFIPGPPCMSGGSHDPTPAEGYARIHEGIHGIGGLAPSEFDWRGPVAEITIRRLMNP